MEYATQCLLAINRPKNTYIYMTYNRIKERLNLFFNIFPVHRMG